MIAVYVLAAALACIGILKVLAALGRARQPLHVSAEWIRDHAPDREL